MCDLCRNYELTKNKDVAAICLNGKKLICGNGNNKDKDKDNVEKNFQRKKNDNEKDTNDNFQIDGNNHNNNTILSITFRGQTCDHFHLFSWNCLMHVEIVTWTVPSSMGGMKIKC